MTDEERMDWIEDNLWNGWGIYGGSTIDNNYANKVTYIVCHKSGSPQIERDNLREALDDAILGKEL